MKAQMPSWLQKKSSESTPHLLTEHLRCKAFSCVLQNLFNAACIAVMTTSDTIYFLQMYDLYERKRIDTKADIWVSQVSNCCCGSCEACIAYKCKTAFVASRANLLLGDVQALGCLLFFISYGKLAFVGEAKLQVLNGDYSMPPRPQRPEPLRQLLRHMLTVSPADRPDIDTVLQQLGQLATNLNVDQGLTSISTPPASRPITPAAPSQHQQRQQQQQPQPVSGNPADLVAAPLPSAGHTLPARSASSGSLKGSMHGAAPGRTSSPAPLSPTHPCQTGQ